MFIGILSILSAFCRLYRLFTTIIGSSRRLSAFNGDYRLFDGDGIGDGIRITMDLGLSLSLGLSWSLGLSLCLGLDYFYSVKVIFLSAFLPVHNECFFKCNDSVCVYLDLGLGLSLGLGLGYFYNVIVIFLSAYLPVHNQCFFLVQ